MWCMCALVHVHEARNIPTYVTECGRTYISCILVLSFQYTFPLLTAYLQPWKGMAYLLNLKKNEET